MKDMLVPIDQAGRIVLPKGLRDELAIKPGDVFKVAIDGSVVTLTPNGETAGFIRTGKALVFSTIGGPVLTQQAVEETARSGREEHRLRNSKSLTGRPPRQ